MNELYHVQLRWIRALHDHSPEWLNAFFSYCRFLDSIVFYMPIALIIWMGYRKERGIDLLALALISGLMNHILKQYYDLPRPFHVDPTVNLVWVSGSGFPSGAAQTAMLWGGAFMYFWNRKSVWILASFFIFFMSFVRVYIGVHFPTDILMGWFVGGVLLTGFICFEKRVKAALYQKPAIQRFSLLVCIAFLICTLFFSIGTARYFFIILGFLIGGFLNAHYNPEMPDPKRFIEGVLRAISSLAQFIVLAFVLSHFLSFTELSKGKTSLFAILIILSGVWLSFITPKINIAITKVFERTK